jgi:mannose-6-phosphate isomerase-like protein (cupin superfamily)
MNLATTHDALPVRLGDVARLQAELSKFEQYQPITKHYFHGGMYCREVWRDAGVLVVGKVHKKEHFYLIVSGRVSVTTDDGVVEIGAGSLLLSKPGTKRAVFAHEPTTCMTFHRTEATTVETAEAELTEDDPHSMYTAGKIIKAQGVLS